MDFLGDWDPSNAAAKGSGAKRLPEVPARPFGKPLSRPMGTPPTPNVAPQRMPPPTPAAVAPPAARVPSVPPKPVMIRPSPAAAPPRVSKPLGTHPAPPPAAAKPLGKIIPGATPASPAAPKPAAAALAASASVTDERVRELHARLVEAKRQTQDGAAVSVEGLARSLKATEAKLREQHKNRKIDFDVVIKDGKAVLKPIVR
jgi:hypothetical protein